MARLPRPALSTLALPTLALVAGSLLLVGAPLLDEAQKAKAKELEGQVKNAAFPYKEQREASNAKVFAYLAATSKEAPVIAAALKGMAATYSASPRAKNKALVDDIYRGVVLARIDDPKPQVQAAAVRASGHAPMPNCWPSS
jgi:hypothetical protein